MQCRKKTYYIQLFESMSHKKTCPVWSNGKRIKRYIHEKTLVWKIIGIQQYNEERDKYSGG